MSLKIPEYQVRAVHCDYHASDDEVYEALKRATDPLDKAWAKLKQARRIAIKFNQDKMLKQLVMNGHHRQQLVKRKRTVVGQPDDIHASVVKLRCRRRSGSRGSGTRG